jgi:hypothetical protein
VSATFSGYARLRTAPPICSKIDYDRTAHGVSGLIGVVVDLTGGEQPVGSRRDSWQTRFG